MALALTYEIKESFLEKCAKGFKILVGALTLTGTYTADGEAMDISAYFPNELQFVNFETKAGFLFEYDYTAKKVKAFYPRAAIASTLAVSAHAGADVSAHAGAAVSAHVGDSTPVTSTNATMPAHDVTQPDNHSITQPDTHSLTGVAGVVKGAGEEVSTGDDITAATGIRFMAIGW